MRRTLIIVLAVAAIGCIGDPCDPNQTFVGGLCQDVPPDAAPHPDAAARDGGDAEAPSVAFNTACTADDQCGGVTNYCAIIPGDSAGFCTHTGCLEDATVCAAGQTCIDLTSYGATGLSICYGAAQ